MRVAEIILSKRAMLVVPRTEDMLQYALASVRTHMSKSPLDHDQVSVRIALDLARFGSFDLVWLDEVTSTEIEFPSDGDVVSLFIDVPSLTYPKLQLH